MPTYRTGASLYAIQTVGPGGTGPATNVAGFVGGAIFGWPAARAVAEIRRAIIGAQEEAATLPERTGTGETAAGAQVSEGAGTTASTGTGSSSSAPQASIAPGTNAIVGPAATSAIAQAGDGIATNANASIGVTLAGAQLDVGTGAAAIDGGGATETAAQVAAGAGITVLAIRPARLVARDRYRGGRGR